MTACCHNQIKAATRSECFGIVFSFYCMNANVYMCKRIHAYTMIVIGAREKRQWEEHWTSVGNF